MNEGRLNTIDRHVRAQERDRWLDTTTGGLPQVPTRDALPDPSADLAFRLVGIRDPDDDHVYVCLKVSGAWDWVEVA